MRRTLAAVALFARPYRFIEAEIMPLPNSGDNMWFFDHLREWARTDFDGDDLPRPEWEALLRESKDRCIVLRQPRRAAPPGRAHCSLG